MKIQRDGNRFTIEADDEAQAKTLEAIFDALEMKRSFRKATVSVELEFEDPSPDPKAKATAAKAKPKAKAKAKAK